GVEHRGADRDHGLYLLPAVLRLLAFDLLFGAANGGIRPRQLGRVLLPQRLDLAVALLATGMDEASAKLRFALARTRTLVAGRASPQDERLAAPEPIDQCVGPGAIRLGA